MGEGFRLPVAKHSDALLRVTKIVLRKFCEPIAWLSELTKQRQYIGLAVEKLEALMV